MTNKKDLKDELLDLIRNNYLSKLNAYKLVFIGYLLKKYEIPMNCKFDNYITFIQYAKEEISNRSYSKDEILLLDQCLTYITKDLKVNDNGLKRIINLLNTFSKESYLDFIRDDLKNLIEKYNTEMPEQLCKLVLKILSSKKNGYLADLKCDNGSFLTYAVENSSNISVLGITKNSDSLLNTEIRLYMINCDYQVDYENNTIIQDSFSKYDSVFCFFPPDSKDKSIYYNNFINTKNNSELWKYVDNAISMLNAKGKAVFILNNAPLFRTSDLEFRKYLIDNKLVETIIELPNNILYNTQISTSILVLSKNNNMINMIDATKMYTSNKKLNIIDEEQIYNAYINNENKISDLTIKDKNYSFIASNYLYDVSKTMSNPIKLKDYVEIYRGYRGLKENENDDKVKIIQISNLNSSFIDNNELDIISYDSNMKKDLLQNNDIIFSRITRNFQCHLVHIEDNEKVIASENIIILRVKDNKFLSPHYLKEYLNSENGKNSVFANQVKSVSTMIQINGLSETYINLLPMDKQLEIEKLSISKYEELINNKKKIASINSSIINLLDN